MRLRPGVGRGEEILERGRLFAGGGRKRAARFGPPPPKEVRDAVPGDPKEPGADVLDLFGCPVGQDELVEDALEDVLYVPPVRNTGPEEVLELAGLGLNDLDEASFRGGCMWLMVSVFRAHGREDARRPRILWPKPATGPRRRIAPTMELDRRTSVGRRSAARDRSSTWGSEESREFLQERIRRFSGTVLLITAAFFVAGWAISVTWTPDQLVRGLQLAPLACFVVYLIMWLATRGKPLPGPVLHLVDGAGTVLACILEIAMSFVLPIELRPDLLAVIGVFGLLLYRAAIVPSEPRRTAWIGVLSAFLLPIITYVSYARAGVVSLPHPGAYSAYALLFGIVAVLLSTKISTVIYGLRADGSRGPRLGQYTLEEKIGEGGMGAVYGAQHALLRRPTAIKMLPPQRAGEMDIARFEREVQLTAQLTSPHTVSIYDYGRTPDGLFYYAMEFLEGIDLEELVRRDGPMPPGRVVHVLDRCARRSPRRTARASSTGTSSPPTSCCRARRPVRHRQGRRLRAGQEVTGADAGVTLENTVPGTPHYMAPESLGSADRIDARSDIYSLGATAYFLLTGRHGF